MPVYYAPKPIPHGKMTVRAQILRSESANSDREAINRQVLWHSDGGLGRRAPLLSPA
jgi:hypothetical protein